MGNPGGHHRHQGDDPRPLRHRLEHQPDLQAVERRRSGLPGRHGGDPGEDGPDMAVTKTYPVESAVKQALLKSVENRLFLPAKP